MTATVELRCACGSVRGAGHGLSARTGTRVVCYCIDCQTYARHLGHAEQVLDAAGGTEIFQTTPRRVTIEAGLEHLRCLRQSPKGALRWYAGCCNTPVANGIENPRYAFAGLVRPFLRFDSDADREATLGPVLGAVLPEQAQGAPLHPRASRSLLGRTVLRILWGSARGHHRPTPFFDDAGRPVAKIEAMDLQTRRRLQAEVRGTP